MKKNGKYRFSLQFPAETEEQIQVGELLEKLGNRKSAVVVQAISEFLNVHQELLNPSGKIEIHTIQTLSQDQIKEMVESIVQKRLSFVDLPAEGVSDSSDAGVDVLEMLNNMDVFQ